MSLVIPRDGIVHTYDWKRRTKRLSKSHMHIPSNERSFIKKNLTLKIINGWFIKQVDRGRVGHLLGSLSRLEITTLIHFERTLIRPTQKKGPLDQL